VDFLPRGIIASGPHNGGGLDMTILNGLSPEPSRAIVASFRGLGQLSPAQQAFLDLTPQQRAAAAQQKAIFNGLGQMDEAPSFPWTTVGLAFLTVAIVIHAATRE
jgi:hypothetical protein